MAALHASSPSAAGKKPAQLEYRALQLLAERDPGAAERLFRALVQRVPSHVGGWLGLRGALEAQGQTEAAAALRAEWARAAPDMAAAIEGGVQRRLSSRGLVFDPQQAFALRRIDKRLTSVGSLAEVHAGRNVMMTFDPGGAEILHDPVVELDGAGPARPLRYRSARQFLASIANATVFGEGMVLTETGELIGELQPPCDPAKYRAAVRGDQVKFEPERYLDGRLPVVWRDTPAFLLAGPTDHSYGDWHMNFVPRLGLYRAAGLDCPVIVPFKPKKWVLPTLAALGIGPDRVIFHGASSMAMFRKLYVPSWPSRDKCAPIEGLFAVAQSRAPPPVGERKLLYLVRRGLTYRPLVNEDEVCALFASRGFMIFSPGELDFQETLRLFANPACVAGPFGSAYLNLAFSRARPFCLALMPKHLPYHLDEMVVWQGEFGSRFAYVEGDMPPGPHDPTTPWTVPIERVERVLDAVLERIARAG
jgi:hypothetical protein